MTSIRPLLLSALLFCCTSLPAQTTTDVRMADGLRAEGKIYVVVAVIVAIFAGIVLYLVRLDRKLTKLEKNHHHNI